MKQSGLKNSILVTLFCMTFIISCTKERKAALPEGEAEDVIALSDIPEVQGTESKYKIYLDGQKKDIISKKSTLIEDNSAQYEVTKADVPSKLSFLFKDLFVRSKNNKPISITFSANSTHLTVFKVVTSLNELTTSEKNFILLKDEVALQRKLAKTASSSERIKISSELQKLSNDRKSFKSNQSQSTYLVPIVQYKIESYGILEKVRNENGDQTSVLKVKFSDWANATHIKISQNSQRFLPLDASEIDDLIALDDIPEVQGTDSKYKLYLEGQVQPLNSKNTNSSFEESSRYEVTRAEVPENLAYLFENLFIRSKSNTPVTITFSKTSEYITAYKVVNSLNQLDSLERSFAVLKDEVALEEKIMKSRNTNERQQLSIELEKVKNNKKTLKANGANANYLVPIVQFKIEFFGVLDNLNDPSGEELLVLKSKSSTWSEATHIKVSQNSEKFLPVDITDISDLLAIDEIPDVQGLESTFKVNLDAQKLLLTPEESVLAENEVSRYPVKSLEVPKKLEFIFKNLYIRSKNTNPVLVTFSVSPSHLTVYKIAKSLNELGTIESNLVFLKDEVALDAKLQRTDSLIEKQKISKELQRLSLSKVGNKKLNSENTYLIPIVQFKIENYGTLENEKKPNGEYGSILKLKDSSWAQATHIKVSTNSDKFLPIDLNESNKKIYKRLFTVNSIQEKFLLSKDLKGNYSIPNSIPDNSLVRTFIDESGLNVFEFVTFEQLDSVQQRLVKAGEGLKNIYSCDSKEVETASKLKPELLNSCFIVKRLIIPVKFVELELPVVDNFGNKSGTITPNIEADLNKNTQLIYIPSNVEYTRVEMDGLYDQNTFIKVSDIKNKEFFMRRTLEDAPETTTFMPGEASPLSVVRFELEHNAISVKKVDLLTKNKTGVSSIDQEEAMRIPVTYFRKVNVDAKGNRLATPDYIRTNKDLAEFIVVDWTENKINSADSPISAYGRSSCISKTADMMVENLNLALHKGILNFSIEYSVNLSQSENCFGIYYPQNDYNPSGTYAQFTARLKERISFKYNDGSTNAPYVKQVPFNVQNALGYGVWTIGRFNPSDNGARGREGQQIDLPVVHDFRNGRVLKYTVTGLPTDNAEKREIFKSSVIEIVEAWNKAYKRAFEGTPYQRQHNYIDVQFSGENGITAHLGDLDHNIIHFENKFNDNHGVLGISQVGFNDRSGIIVADSLIIYAGNVSKYVENTKRNVTIAQNYKEKLATFKNSLKEQAKQEIEPSKSSNNSQDSDIEAAPVNISNSEFAEFGAKKINKKLAKAIQQDLRKKANLKTPKGYTKSNNRYLNRLLVNTSLVRQKISSHLDEVRKIGGTQQLQFTPNVGSAYIVNAMKRVRSMQNPSLIEIEGVISDEMLKTIGTKLSAKDRIQLKKSVQLGQLRTQMKQQFQNKPGCMLEPRESFNTNLKNQTFGEALKAEIFFTLSHEMGHSQGLTHNFIASFDKANFSFADEKDSPRNYSSVMDYVESSQMYWDGLGPYDVHAIRAAHTGLVEADPFFIKNNQNSKNLINNKFISIDYIQNNLAKQGWTSFSRRNVQSVVKNFKYCTDKDVGWEPTCLRFDFGTSAQDIVANQIEDYRENYINNYHAWDRLEFGYAAKSAAMSRMLNTMYNTRPYMDELFYKAVIEGANSPVALSTNEVSKTDLNIETKKLEDAHQAVIQDYIQAAQMTYLFYIEVVSTPEADTLFNDLANRLVSVPYEYRVNGADGKPVTIKDIEVVEKKSTLDLAITPERLDTIGIEEDRIVALQMLTMKGYPSYKYLSKGLELSFMDFEKYVLGMAEGTQSIITRIMTSIFSDNISPLFNNDKVVLQPIPDAKAEVTSALRAYAGIFSILGLESQTLKDKDNFANFFKVGSSPGRGPRDRITLTQLGVDKNSKTKLSYWAFDNAVSADSLVRSAAKKYFFLDNEASVTKLLESLSAAHIALILDDGKDQSITQKLTADLNTAKTNFSAELTKLNDANEKGIVTDEEIKAGAPDIALMTDMVLQINDLIVQSFQSGQKLEERIRDIDEQFPLFDYSQKVFVKVLSNKLQNEEVSAQLQSVINGGKTELKYGLIMKNLQFLNQLTFMVNPEYNR